MNFEKMTRRELINKLKEVQSNRAFSYEDQMKLRILDYAPFTIWTSTRDCRIRLWEGKCSQLYGYDKAEVIDKNYINLFVNEDEKIAALRDQIDIIDNNAKFHNIANDIAANGNILPLLTNCFRIEDINTGEYLNAEMGLLINYYDQEKARLEEIVNESRKIKFNVDQLIELVEHNKQEFYERVRSLQSEINKTKISHAKLGQNSDVENKFTLFRQEIKEIETEFEGECNNKLWEISRCGKEIECKSIIKEYCKNRDILLDKLSDVTCEFIKITNEINQSSLFSEQDQLRQKITQNSSQIRVRIYSLLDQTTSKASNLVTAGASHESKRLHDFNTLKDELISLSSEIDIQSDELRLRIARSNSINSISDLKALMEEFFSESSSKVSKITSKLSGI